MRKAYRASHPATPSESPPSQDSLGYVLGGFEIGEAYLYRPSSCPSDILLPIREKDLTYRLDCIAIRFFEHNNRTYPSEPSQEGDFGGFHFLPRFNNRFEECDNLSPSAFSPSPRGGARVGMGWLGAKRGKPSKYRGFAPLRNVSC